MSFVGLRAAGHRYPVLAVLVLAAAACGRGDTKVDSTSVAPARAASPMMGSTPSTDTASAMGGMMTGMSGDADHDFLRMMSDHHRGLIALVHMTQDKTGIGSAAADATKMDAAQDKELDQMMTMLEKSYKDAYAPKVIPEHQAMADELKVKSGNAYERTFYQDVIKHHQEALAMIDDYASKAKNVRVREMASAMKAAQAREIADFQKKLGKLGG